MIIIKWIRVDFIDYDLWYDYYKKDLFIFDGSREPTVQQSQAAQQRCASDVSLFYKTTVSDFGLLCPVIVVGNRYHLQERKAFQICSFHGLSIVSFLPKIILISKMSFCSFLLIICRRSKNVVVMSWYDWFWDHPRVVKACRTWQGGLGQPTNLTLCSVTPSSAPQL